MSQIFFVIIGFVGGIICAYIYETFMPVSSARKRQGLVIGGYKLHHSLYGILLFLLVFIGHFKFETSIILVSTGIGVIFEHCLTGGGLDFITKE